ncbi:hypothetical protein [Gemmatimonas sp.]|uniref:hypothetical protein n=1 Tax=Gemmatimonas sp. TaxID=1962908 RepID=UPI00286ACE02|nr:hypothetical protein [Gemmatimonas sp.]
MIAASLGGQGRPLVGSVGPQAFGPPAPAPKPIGGLSSRPIPRGEPRMGYLPYRVADAPRFRGGVAVSAPSAPERAPRRPTWTPTAEKPKWVIDTTLTPVQSQRDLLVTDVVCNYAGACRARTQRVAARWVARCGCYAFADGWNRVWRVE